MLPLLLAAAAAADDARFASLEATVMALRGRLDEQEAAIFSLKQVVAEQQGLISSLATTSKTATSVSGRATPFWMPSEGRRTSEASCCRWTHDATCGASMTYDCTALHECARRHHISPRQPTAPSSL